MNYRRTLIAAIAIILLASACGKSSRRNSAPTPLPETAGTPAQVSQADGYGFGTDGFTPGVDFYPGRFVVGFKSSAKAARTAAGEVDYNPRSRLYQNTELAALAREIRDRYGVKLDKEAYVRNVNFAGYQTPGGACAREVMERIQADYAGAIEYIEYDGVRELQYVPNDPDYTAGNLWGMEKINADDAWDTERGDSDVLVCVIDTGVRYSGTTESDYPDHEDLADNYLHPPDHWPDETFDLVYNDNVPEDNHGHGSHVSGTIGAVGDNGKGVVGVVHTISMVQIRVFDTGSSPSSRIAAAIVLGTEIGSDVINMSLGGSTPSSATKSACEDAYDEGVFLAVAAANSNTSKPYYPAYYEVCCAVGATREDPSDYRASFSNYGQWVDIAAPGTNIRSCGRTSTSAYMNWQGTSMAAPHVAGAAALLLSYDPTLTVDQLRAALESTGADLTSSQWQNPDIKRLDVAAALDFVVDDEFGEPPTVEITSPAGQESVSGTVTIEADAEDSDGSILKVFFLVNDVLMGTDDTEPYTYEWDSTKFLNGENTLKAVALDDQHMTGSHTITVTVDNEVEAPNYFIDFEDGAEGWWSLSEMGSTGYWHLVDNDGASGTHSYHFGGAGGANYGNNEFDRLFSPVIDLSGLEAVRLKFKHRYAIEEGDYAYVLINDGSYEFVYLDWFGKGTQSSWTERTYSLNSYIGQSVQIVFFFISNHTGTAAGWWIDDFSLEKKTDPCDIDITSPAEGAAVSGVTDFTAGVTDDVDVTLVELYIDDVLMDSFTDDGPYEYSWTTNDYHGGYHELKVYTEDEWPTSSEDSIASYVRNHTITGIDVDTGVTGTTVTLEGTYFIADSGDAYNASTDKLYFTGASGWTQASVSDWQSDSITATVPADAVTGAVMVDLNGAQVSSSFDFAVQPHLDALTPAVQIVGGNITVEGTGFGNEANEDSLVAIGGVECAIVSWSNTEIEMTIPSGVAQSNLTVTVTAGESNGLQFTPRPNILSFAPTRTWVGQQLTIGGTSFGSSVGSSTVTFTGPVTASPDEIVSWGETEIVLHVPMGALRGDVIVTVNGVDSAGAWLLLVLAPPGLGGLGQY